MTGKVEKRQLMVAQGTFLGEMQFPFISKEEGLRGRTKINSIIFTSLWKTRLGACTKGVPQGSVRCTAVLPVQSS